MKIDNYNQGFTNAHHRRHKKRTKKKSRINFKSKKFIIFFKVSVRTL